MTARTTESNTDYLMIVRRESCTDGTFAWAAYHPDLPGCLAQGDTAEEAIGNLAEARDLYLEDLIERGLPLPAPGSSWLARAIVDTSRTG